MNIVVLGAGNVGSAYAAELALNGNTVALLKTTERPSAHFDALEREARIELREGTERRFAQLVATRDAARALDRELDVVVVATRTTGHERAEELLSRYLRHARLVLVTPGYLGSAYLAKSLGAKADIYAEGESPAFDSRIEEPGRVRIYFRNVRNALAFLPKRREEEGLRIARELVPTYGYLRANAVESALLNPNLVLHTAGCVTSAARIETARDEFRLYREGFTPSVWRLVERLDAEKDRVLEAFGVSPTAYLDACLFRNERDMTQDAREVFERYGREGGPKGPNSLESRYLTEDVPNGLGLLADLGEAVGVETPVARALIAIAGALLGRDLAAESRTLKKLGFESANELRAFLND